MKTKLGLICSAIAILLMAQSNQACADTFSYDFTDEDWNSPEWSLTGFASWANDISLTPNQRLGLTDNNHDRAAGAWLNKTNIMPQQDWSVSSRVQMQYGNPTAADGISLILQTTGTSAVPAVWDFGLNYANNKSALGTFVCINLDDFLNDGLDTSADSVGVFTSTQSSKLYNADLPANYLHKNYTTGYYQFDVSYTSATHTLAMSLDNGVPADGGPWSGNVNVDLGSLFGTSSATVGFASYTGGAGQNHSVLETTINAVPEPSSMALVGLGLLGGGILAIRRRKK